MIKIGIIGYGYWGPNLVRNFSVQKNGMVYAIADSMNDRLELVKKNYPNVKTFLESDELINDPNIDAIVIATPVFTHFDLAKKALLKGKHVLIEKPMTSSVAEAEELINLSEQKGLTLMVDHTYLYTGAVQKMKQLIEKNELGNIRYMDSTRINLGLFQPDINVLWDLAPHDISILNFLIKEKPLSVNANGVSHTNNKLENIAYLTLNYQSGFIAHFNCSWSSPVKLRVMLIGGDEKMIVFNDIEPTEKIRIYQTSYNHITDEEMKRIQVDYRAGDVFIPKLDTREALHNMASDFVNAIFFKTIPESNSQIGIDVVRILEASSESLRKKGEKVNIK